MKKFIKVIRICAFLIVLVFFMCEVSDVIVNRADTVSAIKISNILYHTLPVIFIAFILLIVILIKNPRLKALRVTVLDVLSIVMFVVLMMLLKKEVSTLNEIVGAFQGNNTYAWFYSNGIGGDKGCADIEKVLADEIKKTESYDEFEEIYRIQVGEKIFVYFQADKEDRNDMIEFSFFKHEDLYYSLGSTHVCYNWRGTDDSCTTEETIRNDIINTMWRGDGNKELEAPAWGVSTDEQIFSMTIDSERVDDVIPVNEIDEKKYYFWIITNVGEIETVENVKEAEIEM